MEDLQGNVAVVLQIPDEINGGHSTAAQLALDGVAVGKGGFETAEEVSQGVSLREVSVTRSLGLEDRTRQAASGH
jgi:hypothetical protein